MASGPFLGQRQPTSNDHSGSCGGIVPGLLQKPEKEATPSQVRDTWDARALKSGVKG